ncbi:uncharacterized protein L969DRAFT_84138 [Mixia osmundae IAM 14324]|uniref:Mitochondrial import inner membrane translocase subunit TIM50 n=1 Tax=Mixia osmundae (strain CBS 9802 / IAM 14324 / JCM 22182 / KY 12970) TaxID=764103 RepID=G7E0D0_MIXOS|nr:uncharacterized protein L969DRAFT_84138 [Mixia osmundae IAM 14324]KEI42282.1 hypothetical protein L969DRAFT_84138 [Mixia osmundae IAM 14324]GAA96290.1 hypothetical protein E5Q_02956 [Mixia osmundae IAM 14324]
MLSRQLLRAATQSRQTARQTALAPRQSYTTPPKPPRALKYTPYSRSTTRRTDESSAPSASADAVEKEQHYKDAAFPEHVVTEGATSSDPAVLDTRLGQQTQNPLDTQAVPSSAPPDQAESSQAIQESTTAARTPSTAAGQSLTRSNETLASSYLDATEVLGDEPRTGAKSTAKGRRSMSSIEKKRQTLTRSLLGLMTAGAGVLLWHMGRDWDDDAERLILGSEVPTDGALPIRYYRAKARLVDLTDYFNKPAWTPLLPPELPATHQKPYTLILDLDDLLVHSEWSREHGWRTAKRPGVDYFLAYLNQFFEIVVFTNQPAYTALPIIEKLDPLNCNILYKLFRDCTRYKDRQYIKDLNYLGRDLAKVIILDTNKDNFPLHPNNGAALKPWHGERDDKELIAWIPFLEAVGINMPRDVRPIFEAYEGQHIPTLYAQKEAAMKKQVVEQWEKEQEAIKSQHRGWNLASFFGLSSAPRSSAPPRLPIEIDRERAQAIYLDEQKYWKDNEESIKKMMQEDIDKQTREMRSSVLGMLSAFSPPPPQSGEPAQR